MRLKGAFTAPLLVIAVLIAAAVFVRADEPPAHVHVRLKACRFPPGAVLRGTYHFQRIDAAADPLSGHFTLHEGQERIVVLDLDLPAGFYMYDVQLPYDGDATHTPPPLCANPGYIGLLPGHSRTIAGDMDGEGDLVPPLLLMGTLPPGYSATLVRYIDTVDCGGSTAGIRTSAVDRFEIQDSAYYADQPAGGKQFGLTVTSPTARKVTFVLEGAYAGESLNGPPAYARYDITTDLFQRALAHTPEGSVVCVGTPTTDSG